MVKCAEPATADPATAEIKDKIIFDGTSVWFSTNSINMFAPEANAAAEALQIQMEELFKAKCR